LVLLAGLVLALGPAGDRACLASDDAGGRLNESPTAIQADFIPAGDADWEAYGPSDRSQFGQAVASAGNVDGYHFDDILVGAPIKGASQGEGTAYLFLNTGGGLNTTPVWEKSSGMQGAYFGYSVAGAGDVNNDGLDDAIIGAPNYKGMLLDKEVQLGRAFVYQGVQGVGLTIEHTWSYTGTIQFGGLGHAVAGAGDVNGDGIADIVVGAPYYNLPEAEDSEGAIYVFFGHDGTGPSADPDWLIESNQPGAWFGFAVSAAGDVNNDGCDDLIVGAPRYVNPETGVREGAVFLFLGCGTPASAADAAWVAYGWQEYAQFGAAVAGAGNVNVGRPDIVVGAPGYDRLFIGEVGAAYAFCGNGSTFGSDPCWTAYGSSIGGRFGASVGGAGDINADGFDEVIVGAPLHLERLPNGTQPEGAAFVYFGSATGLSPWAGWKARGDKSRTDFGAAVGSAGRVTIDDVDSVFIGAPQYFINEVPWGAAFAFYGPIEPAALNRVFLPLILRNAN
jgi:hypothetical protein